jgi:hypothetical protein
MRTPQIMPRFVTGRGKPRSTDDGPDREVDGRADPYGGQYIVSPSLPMQELAEEGSFFTASNATPGTGVAYALTTAFNDTTGAMFVLKNNAKVKTGKRVRMHYLRLALTAAPTATVSMEFAVKTDDNSREPTAGATQQSPVNVNHDDTTGSDTMLYSFNGAGVTVPASSKTARLVARTRIPTSLGIVGDEYGVAFGGMDPAAFGYAGLTAARAVAVARLWAHAAPVIIGPQQWAVIYMWWLTAATAAPSFEWEFGLSER